MMIVSFQNEIWSKEFLIENSYLNYIFSTVSVSQCGEAFRLIETVKIINFGT